MTDIMLDIVQRIQKLENALEQLSVFEALNTKLRTYTPVWAAATTNPVINNGSIVGGYTITGNICQFSINLTMISMTTYVSGAYNFSLPVQVAASGLPHFGFGALYDTSTGGRYDRNILFTSNSLTIVQFIAQADGATVTTISPTIPFTWAAGDILSLCGIYPVA